MGGDESVIAAARVSNGISYEDASKGTEKDQKLINFLVKHRHGTPFEHTTFQFYVKCPLFIRSEWMRHRVASYNEISGRYVEYEPEFYIPNEFRVPGLTNKQGSVFPENSPTQPYINLEEWNQLAMAHVVLACRQSYRAYQDLLALGVSKEMARTVLPSNLYTQFYMTVNARSLMNFLGLRAAEDAMWEIRQYAITMKEMFKEAMPLTYNAWEQNNYIAP